MYYIIRPYCKVAHPAMGNNPEILIKSTLRVRTVGWRTQRYGITQRYLTSTLFFLFVCTVAWRTQRYVVIQCMLLCDTALQMLMAFARTFYIVQYVDDGNSAQCSFFIADLDS